MNLIKAFIFSTFLIHNLTSLYSSRDTLLADENSTLQEFYFQLSELQYKNRYFPDYLNQAQSNLQKSFSKGLAAEKVYWRLARIARQKGKTTFIKRERRDIFEKGSEWGKKAIQINKRHSPSHLWYASSLGSFMIEEGLKKTLKLKNEVRDEFQLAANLNQENDLAILGLAYWYFKIPIFFGGDDDFAFQLLEKAKLLDKDQSSHIFVKAEFYEDLGEIQKAIDFYQKVIEFESKSDFSEMYLDQYVSAQRLEQLKKE